MIHLLFAIALLLLPLQASAQRVSGGGGGGGGGSPTGAAGGDLSGTYPNPTVSTYNTGTVYGTMASKNVPASGIMASDGSDAISLAPGACLVSDGSTLAVTAVTEDCTSGSCASMTVANTIDSDAICKSLLIDTNLTLPQAGTAGFTAGTSFSLKNNGSTARTVTTTTSTYPPLAASTVLTVRPKDEIWLTSFGGNWQASLEAGDAARLSLEQNWTAGQAVTPTAGGNTGATTVTPNLALSNSVTYTLTGNITLANPSNVKAGQHFDISLVQDGTGSRTITLGSNYKFVTATAPTWSTGAGKEDTLHCWARSTTVLVCSALIDVR